MGMTMQNHINIIWRFIWRNVLQAKFQVIPHEIDDQWPFRAAVAIASDNRHPRPDRSQFVQNRFRANIAEMPDLVRACRQAENRLRKFVMRIGKNEDFHAASARQTPTTKPQAPGKIQAPSFKSRFVLIWSLMIGASLGFGFCDLGSSLRRVI